MTSQGNKNLITIAAEGRPKPARHPHDADLVAACQCRVAEPVNDIMEPLIAQNGK